MLQIKCRAQVGPVLEPKSGVTTGLCPKCTFKYRQPKGCTDGRVVVCSVVGPAAPAAGWGLALRAAGPAAGLEAKMLSILVVRKKL